MRKDKRIDNTIEIPKEKCHRHRGVKDIACLIPDHLNLLNKIGGWGVC